MVWSNNSHKIRTLLMPFFDCRTVFRAAGGAILDGDAGEVDFSCERGRTDRASSPFVKEAAGSRRFAIALMLVWPFFVFAYLLHMSRCIRSVEALLCHSCRARIGFYHRLLYAHKPACTYLLPPSATPELLTLLVESKRIPPCASILLLRP